MNINFLTKLCDHDPQATWTVRPFTIVDSQARLWRCAATAARLVAVQIELALAAPNLHDLPAALIRELLDSVAEPFWTGSLGTLRQEIGPAPKKRLARAVWIGEYLFDVALLAPALAHLPESPVSVGFVHNLVRERVLRVDGPGWCLLVMSYDRTNADVSISFTALATHILCQEEAPIGGRSPLSDPRIAELVTLLSAPGIKLYDVLDPSVLTFEENRRLAMALLEADLGQLAWQVNDECNGWGEVNLKMGCRGAAEMKALLAKGEKNIEPGAIKALWARYGVDRDLICRCLEHQVVKEMTAESDPHVAPGQPIFKYDAHVDLDPVWACQRGAMNLECHQQRKRWIDFGPHDQRWEDESAWLAMGVGALSGKPPETMRKDVLAEDGSRLR